MMRYNSIICWLLSVYFFILNFCGSNANIRIRGNRTLISTTSYELPVSLQDLLPVPFNGDSRRFDPNFLLYHHTRYVKGCFSLLKSDYPFSKVVPFVYNFDLLVTSCPIDWNDPKDVRAAACLHETGRRNKNVSSYLSDLFIHPNITYIHVRSWIAALNYFVNDILPKFEQKSKHIILHTGSDDHSVYYSAHGKRILESAVIIRWITEQNADPIISAHPKVLQFPVGFCARELINEAATELEEAVKRTGPMLSLNSISRSSNTSHYENINGTLVITTDSSIRKRKMSVSNAYEHFENNFQTLRRLAAQAAPFHQRKDRIFFCFHTSYPNRARLMDFAKYNCSVCDICEQGSMNHFELWMTYAEYKYVLAPFGNGVDCSRNFEIILLGSIPVMEYFEGSNGYAEAGMKIIQFHSEWEITPHNVSVWSLKFNSSTDRKLVTRQYWNQRAFLWNTTLPYLPPPIIISRNFPRVNTYKAPPLPTSKTPPQTVHKPQTDSEKDSLISGPFVIYFSVVALSFIILLMLKCKDACVACTSVEYNFF